MEGSKLFQVSTLQALAMGYWRTVVTVSELLKHGDTGLGTFEDIGGEMIIADGHCYRALDDGSVAEAEGLSGVPFAAAAYIGVECSVPLGAAGSIEELKQRLTLMIEEDFGLNSMHIVRIDGSFESISARSESQFKADHMPLKDILSITQRDFCFRDTAGTLVCVYFPDYMEGINAAGWHMHFVSADRTRGGHVFGLSMREGTAALRKLTGLELVLPKEPSFDTYSLKEASNKDIKMIEQGEQ